MGWFALLWEFEFINATTKGNFVKELEWNFVNVKEKMSLAIMPHCSRSS